MSALTSDVLRWSAEHHGTLTIEALHAMGISRPTVKRLVRDGLLERVLNGTYRFTGTPADHLARCVAVCAHPDRLAIAGPSGGRLWSLRRMPNDGLVYAIAPPARTPSLAPWLRVYRTSLLPEEDIVERSDGIRVTSPPRTVVDMIRYVSEADVRSIIDDAEHRRLCTVASMRRVAERMNTPGRPWVRRFLAVLDSRPAGGTPESHPESLVVNALIARGIPDLRPQRELMVPGWGPVRLDASVDRIRWGVEVDVHPDHFSVAGADRDHNRDLCCDAIGWRVSRVAEPSLRTDFDGSIDRLYRVYLQRCDEFARMAVRG